MDNPTMFALEKAAEVIVKKMAGSSAAVQSIERWGGGALNECYKITTHRPGETFFVKFENEGIFPTTRRGQIEREVYGIRMAGAAGITVPEVLAYDFTGSETGRKFLVEGFIDAQLFWEIRETLTDQERETLKADVETLLEKMNCITSPLFGDLYPAGVVGQHLNWKDAYRAMAAVLLNDSRALEMFNADEERRVVAALERGAELQEARYPAVLYHGDLGMHNLMVDRSQGFARMGAVIDFGNAFFAPVYANEDGVRAHGGFDLPPMDVQARYGIPTAQQEADGLLLWFEQVIFFGALKKHHNWDPGFPFREGFLDDCAKI